MEKNNYNGGHGYVTSDNRTIITTSHSYKNTSCTPQETIEDSLFFEVVFLFVSIIPLVLFNSMLGALGVW